MEELTNGLTFNSIHSSTLNIVVRSINRQILSASRDEYEYIPGRAGSYLFEEELADRFIEIELAIVENSLINLRKKAREVAKWLRTKQRVKLIFDDEPDKWYMAKVANQLDLEPRLSTGKTEIIFRCLPYANAELAEYDETYLYDTGLEYDTGLIYPNSRTVHDWAFLSPFQMLYMGEREWAGFVWNYSRHMSSQYNYGTLTPLIIEISGNVINPKITNNNNGQYIQINTTLFNQVLIIDSDKMTVTIDGANAMKYMTGDFIQMEPEDNGFFFYGINPYAHVTYNWEHKFL